MIFSGKKRYLMKAPGVDETELNLHLDAEISDDVDTPNSTADEAFIEQYLDNESPIHRSPIQAPQTDVPQYTANGKLKATCEYCQTAYEAKTGLRTHQLTCKIKYLQAAQDPK